MISWTWPTSCFLFVLSFPFFFFFKSPLFINFTIQTLTATIQSSDFASLTTAANHQICPVVCWGEEECIYLHVVDVIIVVSPSEKQQIKDVLIECQLNLQYSFISTSTSDDSGTADSLRLIKSDVKVSSVSLIYFVYLTPSFGMLFSEICWFWDVMSSRTFRCICLPMFIELETLPSPCFSHLQ